MQEFEPFLLRTAQLHDLDAIYAFSKVAGLTNLPADRSLLEADIRLSLDCFASVRTSPLPNDFYFFVLENIRTHALVGCCAIYADIGTKPPLYTFRFSQAERILLLSQEIHRVSELAALYLAPEKRNHHMGAFLSRARYLWMASQPKRFHSTLIACIRGRVDKKRQRPFWELFVQPFFPDHTFDEADREAAMHHTPFIAQHLPHTPIAMDTLDKRAQACISIPNVSSRAAMALLIQEGFAKIDHIDVLDGGPILQVNTAQIHTLKNSRQVTFAGTKPHVEGPVYFIATTGVPFFVSVASVLIDTNNQCCYLLPEVAEKMALNLHDMLCLSPF